MSLPRDEDGKVMTMIPLAGNGNGGYADSSIVTKAYVDDKVDKDNICEFFRFLQKEQFPGEKLLPPSLQVKENGVWKNIPTVLEGDG